MREIVIAANKADSVEPDKEPVEIPLRDEPKDGEKEGKLRIIVAQPPTSGQWTVFMATNASFASQTERIAGALNFFVSLLSSEDHSYIVARLFDRNDHFGPEHVSDILDALIEEWSGRPTEGPSDSASSPPTTGRSSTRRTTKSTSSPSRSIES